MRKAITTMALTIALAISNVNDSNFRRCVEYKEDLRAVQETGLLGMGLHIWPKQETEERLS